MLDIQSLCSLNLKTFHAIIYLNMQIPAEETRHIPQCFFVLGNTGVDVLVNVNGIQIITKENSNSSTYYNQPSVSI